jgi:hypothetical protein
MIYFKCRCDRCDQHSQQTLNYSVNLSVRRLLRVSRCLLSVFRYLLEISLFVLKISSYILKVFWYFKVISMHEKHLSIFLWTATHNKLSCTCGLIWNFLIVLICANFFSLFIVLEHSDTICSIKIRLTIRSDWSQPIWLWNSPTFVFILFLSCFRIIYSLNILIYAVVLIIYFQIIQLGKKWNGKQFRSPLGKSQVF